MARLGRNEPCPCGSGRKHKHCCLRKEVAAELRRDERRAGVLRALDWLVETHPSEARAALDEQYFGKLKKPERDRLADLPHGLQEMIQTNSSEWLAVQAILELDGGRMLRTSDLILGASGPSFTFEQRAYLEELARRPIGLYEVHDSKPGEGILVKNILDKHEPELWIEERSGSEALFRWDVIGTRLILMDGRWQFSASVYPFRPEIGARIHKAVLKVLRDDLVPRGAKWDSAIVNDIFVTGMISGFWLSLLAAPPREMPKLVDAGTGDSLMLVTDHYEVLDWQRLAQALESQPDVEGDRKDGWTRFVELGDERQRSLLAINIGRKPNRIEPFARTLRLADEGRSWLEQIAGDALRGWRGARGLWFPLEGNPSRPGPRSHPVRCRIPG